MSPEAVVRRLRLVERALAAVVNRMAISDTIFSTDQVSGQTFHVLASDALAALRVALGGFHVEHNVAKRPSRAPAAPFAAVSGTGLPAMVPIASLAPSTAVPWKRMPDVMQRRQGATRSLQLAHSAALGMAWWNALTPAERTHWLREADTDMPAAAWSHYRRQLVQ